MNNLILFVNSFLSYIVLMIVIAIVAALGFFAGSVWRKSKNAKDAELLEEVEVVEHITETEVMDTSIRRVSLEEANEFLRIKKEEAPKVSFGVSLCILSPICMFLLGAAGELNMIPLSEEAAGAIGMMILLVIVAVACAIFIPSGMKTKPYEFLEKEIIETEYGVSGSYVIRVITGTGRVLTSKLIIM